MCAANNARHTVFVKEVSPYAFTASAGFAGWTACWGALPLTGLAGGLCKSMARLLGTNATALPSDAFTAVESAPVTTS